LEERFTPSMKKGLHESIKDFCEIFVRYSLKHRLVCD